MPASKPFIQGYYLSPKIDCEVSVMKVVEVVVCLQSFFTTGYKFVKSGMTNSWAYTRMHKVEDGMDRMGRNDPVEKHARKV